MRVSTGDIWRDSEGLSRLIDQHMNWYPSMEPRDVYKLLYQGVLGPEHNVVDENAFRERLLAEYAPLEACQEERLSESVRPDGSLLRVNLRAFKFRDGDLESLILACLSAGRQEWGVLDELKVAWDAFCGFCREGRWPGFGPTSVSECSVWLEARGYPAVHHSPIYRSCYRPSYRLIAGTAWTGLSPDR